MIFGPLGAGQRINSRTSAPGRGRKGEKEDDKIIKVATMTWAFRYFETSPTSPWWSETCCRVIGIPSLFADEWRAAFG